MTNSAGSEDSHQLGQGMPFLARAWSWLTAPLTTTRSASDRRSHLLAWLLISLLLITAGVLVFLALARTDNIPLRNEYYYLILSLDFPVALAYGLNCSGKYAWAAGLTVLCAVLGPWVSTAIDPTILHGDFVPLTYVTVSILLSSILLSPLVTTLMAAAQLVGLMPIPRFSPAASKVNWPSLVALVLFISVLSILANLITLSDLKDIDHQARQLGQSEARLRELSVRDHLTGLFNRRYLEETLEREIQRSLRASYPIGVIMIDIDHFKQINDRWGHAVGDVVLQQIGRMVSANVRSGDIVCRYGGDEFILVLPEAGVEVTRERATRLREAVACLRLDAPDLALGQITISLGVTALTAPGITTDALLRSADGALYRAKNEGRDRVVVVA